MTRRLVPVFAAALDLPEDYFAAAFAEPHCTLRLIHYPPQPDPGDNEFGFATHTDNNFTTFLAQSALPGLEWRAAEGEWIRPPAVPGTFSSTRGDAAVIFERPLQADAAPGHQPQRPLAPRDPVLSRAEPRCRDCLRPDLRRTRQSGALQADHLRRVLGAAPDAEFRPPPSRQRRRIRRLNPRNSPASTPASDRSSLGRLAGRCPVGQ